MTATPQRRAGEPSTAAKERAYSRMDQVRQLLQSDAAFAATRAQAALPPAERGIFVGASTPIEASRRASAAPTPPGSFTSEMAAACKAAGAKLGVDAQVMIRTALDLCGPSRNRVVDVAPKVRAALEPIIAPLLRAQGLTHARTSSVAVPPAQAQRRAAYPESVDRHALAEAIGMKRDASGYEIRRVCANLASAQRGRNSSPKRKQDLAVFLGLPPAASSEQIMRIVGSLTMPPAQSRGAK